MSTTFLQPVGVPERCFLHEVLVWLAFQRLPIHQFNFENCGEEIHGEDCMGDGYVPAGYYRVIFEEECARAGIPIDPRRLINVVPQGYGDEELPYGWERAQKVKQALEERRRQFKNDCLLWEQHYRTAVDYPASRIFVALKGGQLKARGRLLPSVDYNEAMSKLNAEERSIGDLKMKEIPSAFWTLKGINFESNAAKNESEHYCHITLPTADVLSIFPGEIEKTVSVECIGDAYLLSESARSVSRTQNRGRPSFPWDRFHLQAAALLLQNDLPAKKEAAIEYFQSWFLRECGISASRAVIGGKLKPYYDLFVKRAGQKV
jgi:hypothetical protein